MQRPARAAARQTDMENLTLNSSALQRFTQRHRATIAAVLALLVVAALAGYEHWSTVQSRADDDRQIAEHGCMRMPHENGKPDRILCPGNVVISKKPPVY